MNAHLYLIYSKRRLLLSSGARNAAISAYIKEKYDVFILRAEKKKIANKQKESIQLRAIERSSERGLVFLQCFRAVNVDLVYYFLSVIILKSSLRTHNLSQHSFCYVT